MLNSKSEKLSQTILEYVSGISSNWRLQDMLEECEGEVAQEILDEIDCLFDDAPEVFFNDNEESAPIKELLKRIVLFLENQNVYSRAEITSDGFWPFSEEQWDSLKHQKPSEK